jgi:hypothetical protein
LSGCGKGRLLAMGAAYGFTHIIGIDFSKNVRCCRESLQEYKSKKYPDTSITIENADARQYCIRNPWALSFYLIPLMLL